MRYFFLILAILLTASCGSEEQKLDTASYEKTKESLSDKEKKNPLKFLTVTGDNKKNLIGQTVVRGTIKNTASVTAYRDVRIKMLCYKNGSMVEEHEDLVDDIVKSNTVEDFKTKYRLPKGADSIALSVMSAAVAEEGSKK